jgi:hypothetical protein
MELWRMVTSYWSNPVALEVTWCRVKVESAEPIHSHVEATWVSPVGAPMAGVGSMPPRAR